jgi:hypothetical protein
VYSGISSYYVVRGTDNLIYERHATGVWSNAMGAPPGGAGTSPAIAALPSGPIYVAVLDNSNSPWYRQMNSNGTPNGAWTKAGVNSLQGVPGIALNSSVTPHMFALDASQNTIRARCGFGGGCFNPWTNYGPGLGNSGTNAVNYHTSSGFNKISTVLLGLDNKPWVATSDDDGANFGGFTSLGGGVADSSPAMAFFGTAQRLLVTVHRSDGYYVYGITAGVWTAIGSP